MKVKPRYFIRTKDNLFFAVNGYYHPKTHYLAFLRYIPSDDGNRCLNGLKFKKVNSFEAYDFLKNNYPEYLFYANIKDKLMMGVPREDVEEIYNPIEGLRKIRESKDKSQLYEKISLLSDEFHNKCGISYENMGITGSTLIGLQKDDKSDIDFIIFGLNNHKNAVDSYGKLKNNQNSVLDCINDSYWNFVYKKRIKDNSMTLDEFKFYEFRKNNRGLIKDTLFDILLTRTDNEIISDEEIECTPLEKIKIKCKIKDDSLSYDYPAIYHVEDVEFLEGSYENIENIISFTHTYTGIVKNNEEVIASGVCEKHLNKKTGKISYNLIIGTTRESINEYVKLKK